MIWKRRNSQSPAVTVAALTLIKTSFPVGIGNGKSCSFKTSGGPYLGQMIAFMVVGIILLLDLVGNIAALILTSASQEKEPSARYRSPLTLDKYRWLNILILKRSRAEGFPLYDPLKYSACRLRVSCL